MTLGDAVQNVKLRHQETRDLPCTSTKGQALPPGDQGPSMYQYKRSSSATRRPGTFHVPVQKVKLCHQETRDLPCTSTKGQAPPPGDQGPSMYQAQALWSNPWPQRCGHHSPPNITCIDAVLTAHTAQADCLLQSLVRNATSKPKLSSRRNALVEVK